MPKQVAVPLAVALTLLLATAASAVTPTTIDVSWNAPTTSADGTPLTDLDGYRVYVSTPCPGGAYWPVPAPSRTPASGSRVTTTVTGLLPSTPYTARITAVDTSGNESGCSVPVTMVTLAAPACVITPTPKILTFTHPVGGPLPVPQTIRVETTDGSVWRTYDTGFYDATLDCAEGFGPGCASGQSTTVAPTSRSLTMSAGRYEYPLLLRAGPTCPEVTVPVVLVVGDPAPPPPAPVPAPTVVKSVSRCSFAITAQPPDAAGGWTMQLLNGAQTLGSADSTAPYQRTVEVTAGTRTISARWTKGSVVRTSEAVTVACP